MARCIMVGGFLGAGKTTAMLRLGEHLAGRGQRVGLITNDQSVDLVDTQRAKAAGFAVEEVTGGCFCCKFDSLVAAAQQLTRTSAPDVLLAEPVGSCTDIKATVAYPLRKLYGDVFEVAPLSVLVDPVRAARVLGLEPGKAFSDKVRYIYRKQLEEAELLVVNKIDLVDAGRRARLVDELRKVFPQAKVLEMSSRTGEGTAAWFERVAGASLGTALAMAVDYDTYAEGEARLGWLNLRAAVRFAAPTEGNVILRTLAGRVRDALGGAEIAHLKMTLGDGERLGAVSLTRTDEEPVGTHTLQGELAEGELVVNLRAEGEPEALRAAVEKALGSMELRAAEVQVVGAFRPGRPTPTHRVEQPGV